MRFLRLALPGMTGLVAFCLGDLRNDCYRSFVAQPFLDAGKPVDTVRRTVLSATLPDVSINTRGRHLVSTSA